MRHRLVIATIVLIACSDGTTGPVNGIPVASSFPAVHVDYAVQFLSSPPPGIPSLTAIHDSVGFAHVEASGCVSTTVAAGARNDTLVITLRHAPLPAIPCPAPGFLFVTSWVPGVPPGHRLVLVTEQTVDRVADTRTAIDSASFDLPTPTVIRVF